MRMVLLGPPGSDKGEYAVKLAEKYGITLLTISDMLADAVEKRLEVGVQAQAYLEHGQYVPDELLLEVIRDRMAQSDVKVGFVLVGFPRSNAQADSLDEMLQESGMALDLVLHLQVEDEVLLERLEGRRTCISCGTRYNTFTNPPMVHGVCDMCGGRVGRGADSNEVVIGNRLRAYDQQIHSLVSYYLTHDKLREVEGGGSSREVARHMYAAVDEWNEVQAAKTQALMDKVEAAAGAAEQESQAAIQEEVVVEKREGSEPEPAVMPAKKKASVKKAATRKAQTKKKPPVKKASIKKTATKKTSAPKKKTPVKKTATKKAASQKKTAVKKKTPVKKAAAKKAPAKKKVAVKKKVQTKKTAVKKNGPVKKVGVKKSAAKKKAPVKKKRR